MEKYDLIIIGAGPAGYTASIYASRYKVSNLVIGNIAGGLITEAHKVCNYPSEVEISGMELMDKIKKVVDANDGKILLDEVIKTEKVDRGYSIKTRGGKEFVAKTLMLAVGTKTRKLNLPDEGKFLGKGVSYCATCDAMFYKGKTVAVVGGGDSANTAALYLAEVADKVYQIYRGPKLKGEKVWVDQITNHSKIEVVYNTNVIGLNGDNKLSTVKLDKPYKNQEELTLTGLFVEIGTVPDLALFNDLNIDLDEWGFIKVKNDQSTNIQGVWAAGDITDASDNYHQVVTACSEGAVAAHSVFNYLQKNRG